jgi:hypothetical protein
MTPESARALANEWGVAGLEYLAWPTRADSPEGREFAAWLESLPVAKAADEVRAYCALVATGDLADAIAGDLQIDPAIAAAIAEELAAGRKRLAAATRPFPRQIAKD